jgi:hypothetical protein
MNIRQIVLAVWKKIPYCWYYTDWRWPGNADGNTKTQIYTVFCVCNPFTKDKIEILEWEN